MKQLAPGIVSNSNVRTLVSAKFSVENPNS
jgi:hypothetical protein